MSATNASATDSLSQSLNHLLNRFLQNTDSTLSESLNHSFGVFKQINTLT